MVLFEKFGQHMPLNHQAERYAREGVPPSLSTLADQVGTCAGVLEPRRRGLIRTSACRTASGQAKITPHRKPQAPTPRPSA